MSLETQLRNMSDQELRAWMLANMSDQELRAWRAAHDQRTQELLQQARRLRDESTAEIERTRAAIARASK